LTVSYVVPALGKEKAMPDIPPRHRGVPRTLKTARTLGFNSKQVEFADVKDKFIQFADHGSRDGSVCGVAPDPDPRYWSVCYKDQSGRCTWIQVPRTEPVGHD
jgi:hypothetical protein